MIAAMATLRGQSQNSSIHNQQQPSGENEVPVVDTGRTEPTDPDKRALRRTRNSRHDIQDNRVDARQYVLTENSPPIMLTLPAIHAPAEPAIPAEQSDVIVIAEVTDSQAYLSNDKTNIYSEFTLRIEEVLKDDYSAPLSPGDAMTAERPGGAMRFPSGKTLRRGIYGKNMPRRGRYIFFLGRNDQGQTFSLITGYELRAGRVLPLDGIHKAGGQSPQFAAYQTYEGADESVFLNIVRDAMLSRSIEQVNTTLPRPRCVFVTPVRASSGGILRCAPARSYILPLSLTSPATVSTSRMTRVVWLSILMMMALPNS
jgi:hypothetical protein